MTIKNINDTGCYVKINHSLKGKFLPNAISISKLLHISQFRRFFEKLTDLCNDMPERLFHKDDHLKSDKKVPYKNYLDYMQNLDVGL